jgi:hypothetical protein
MSDSSKCDTRIPDRGASLLVVVFYGLALVMSAVVAMTIRVEWLGFWFMEGALFPLAFVLCLLGPNGPLRMGLAMLFWFMEGALFPLAFVLCLLGPNGPLRMGLAMLGGTVVGWFIVSPPAAFVMLFFGITLVLLNGLLIFAGALLGTLLRQGIVVCYKRLTSHRLLGAVHASSDVEIGSE